MQAGILISLPVIGLWPFLAARFTTEYVPKPTNWIDLPFLNVLAITLCSAARNLATLAFVAPNSFAIASINSVYL